MVGCSATGCSNRWEQKVRMYGFPTDGERRKMWLTRARRDDFTPSPSQKYNNYKLCEAHFEADQFCFTRKGRKKLRGDALPSVFAHSAAAKRRKPPAARHTPPHPPAARLTPPPPPAAGLVRQQTLAQIGSEHTYSAKRDQAPVINPPAPQHNKMDFFSMLKMHAIDIVQFQVHDNMRGPELGQTLFEPGQSEREPVSPVGQSERGPVSPVGQSKREPDSPPSPTASACQSPERETQPDSNMSQVEMRAAPVGLEAEYVDLLPPSALSFLQELVCTFDQEVDQVLTLRVSRKAHLDMTGDLPEFREVMTPDPGWRVSPVPPRLSRRHVDVGDLAPCDTQRLIGGLRSAAQGLQIDFDDGNCPTYHNQIKGLHNVYKAVNGLLPEAPPIQQAPVLMLRPRAWNMVEHNMMVNGKEVPGPLFDFGLLMFHCGRKLFDHQSGPFFYLSKVESYHEARLWNNIFVWTQDKLGLPQGTIKATVLIENVLAAFEMEHILFELKEHSAGLNCGIWDYSASFINKFGQRSAFVLPDRSKYVNMQKRFLSSYMDLLVQTCHRRGALATGGMAATLMPTEADSATHRTLLDTVTRLKLLEIKAGVDGFMVYDLSLIEPMQKLFQTHTRGDNQLDQLREDVRVTAEDLLTMPSGGVTLHGLQYNITVGILFIDAWLSGKGHFFYRGQVEDSATAEISRSQVWQWIRHQTRLEDDGRTVTRALVTDLTVKVINHLLEDTHKHHVRAVQRLTTAANMFVEVVQRRDFPEFLTTHLNLDHTFLSSQGGEGAPQSPSLSPPPHPDTAVPLPKLTTRPDPHPTAATTETNPQNTRQLPTLTPRPPEDPTPTFDDPYRFREAL